MDEVEKKIYLWLFVIIAILILLIVAPIGPARIARYWRSYKTDAYGSDWLVVQYAQDGSVITQWELDDNSIGSETGSDGIFFYDNYGNVVHLSGHYIYVQVKDDEWRRKYKTALLKEKP